MLDCLRDHFLRQRVVIRSNQVPSVLRRVEPPFAFGVVHFFSAQFCGPFVSQSSFYNSSGGVIDITLTNPCTHGSCEVPTPEQPQVLNQ